jgi:hypothetical protein
MKLKRKLALGLIGGVAALALGSFAWAAIPDGGGVIHGCYDKHSGAIRVYDGSTNQPSGCTVKEAALDWNQRGPQGVPGPQGAKGDTGPSNGYVDAWSNAPVYIDGVQPTTVASLDLPAGRYVIFAKGSVAGNSGGNVLVQCTLTAGAGYDYTDVDFDADDHTGNVALTIGADLSAAGQAQLRCRALGGASNWASDAAISAVKVGDLAAS